MDRKLDKKMDVRCLRLRMGWTSSDLARRLGVCSADIDDWEQGNSPQDPEIVSRLEFLFRQAEFCSEEVKAAPLAEDYLDRESLVQIDIETLN